MQPRSSNPAGSPAPAASWGGLAGCCDYPGCDGYGYVEHAVRTGGNHLVGVRACDKHELDLTLATVEPSYDWLPGLTEQTLANGIRRRARLGGWWAWGFVFVAFYILISPPVIQQSLGWTVVPDFRLIVSEARQFAGYDWLGGGGDGVSYSSCAGPGQTTYVGYCVQAESSSAAWTNALNNPWLVAWGPAGVLVAFGLLSRGRVNRIAASRIARARWGGADDRRERAVCWAVALAIPYSLLLYAFAVTAIIRLS